MIFKRGEVLVSPDHELRRPTETATNRSKQNDAPSHSRMERIQAPLKFTSSPTSQSSLNNSSLRGAPLYGPSCKSDSPRPPHEMAPSRHSYSLNASSSPSSRPDRRNLRGAHFHSPSRKDPAGPPSLGPASLLPRHSSLPKSPPRRPCQMLLGSRTTSLPGRLLPVPRRLPPSASLLENLASCACARFSSRSCTSVYRSLAGDWPSQTSRHINIHFAPRTKTP